MSVDYESNFCTNVKLTEDMVNYAISEGYLEADFWEEPESYFTIPDMNLVVQGNCYHEAARDMEYYLDIPFSGIVDMANHLPKFCLDVEHYFNVSLKPEDVKIISVLYVC